MQRRFRNDFHRDMVVKRTCSLGHELELSNGPRLSIPNRTSGIKTELSASSTYTTSKASDTISI